MDDAGGPAERGREADADVPAAGEGGGAGRSPFESREIDAVLGALTTGREGLAETDAERRLQRNGPNELETKKTSPVLKFLRDFWGPIPWMIEAAAVLSAIVRHWADLAIIAVLLAVNAGVGFWEEHQAETAVEALKKTLARTARVRRDGAWREVEARDLVTGDVVKLEIGAVVPADIKLFDGDYLSVDQSGLTGESLPVEKKTGQVAFSGSHVEQGSMTGVVVATGMATVFGKTAQLVREAGAKSEFQKAVGRIARYLIFLSLGLIAVMAGAELWRGRAALTVIQFSLILAVASIPVAMPAVLSVTMAVGARALARRKAIVSRLEAIEDLAGLDILCADKTGTLTRNRIRIVDPIAFAGEPKDVVFAAALSGPRDDRDAINRAVLDALEDKGALDAWEPVHVTPFDYVNKRTEAEVRKDGQTFKAAKGAPANILELTKPEGELKARADRCITELAEKGLRTLAVARDDGQGRKLIGLLPMEDPPREDAKATIEEARRHGLTIKMLTGDDLAIARHTAATLGLPGDIETAGVLGLGTEAEARAEGQEAKESGLSAANMEKVEQAAGFAEVFPEHKFNIVKGLQERGHLVGMTGDGVNDAPALKQANVGIAVEGAADTARAAAALVLTEPGLDVIVAAIEEARRVFERMNGYATYRVAETIRIMLFVVGTVLAFGFYPITTVLVILLALLNDLPIMTIAYDDTRLLDRPVKWDMRRVLTIASTLGGLGVLSTFSLLAFAKLWLRMGDGEIQSLVFLKLAFAGHLTLFVTRAPGRFWKRPFPSPILLSAVVTTQLVAAAIVGFGVFVTRLPWRDVLLVWAYSLAWLPLNDQAKLAASRLSRPGRVAWEPEAGPRRTAGPLAKLTG
jgi:H+-transporting ATPase